MKLWSLVDSMTAGWATKSEKTTIVDGDAVLIIDSEDATPSTKDKRVLFSTLADGVRAENVKYVFSAADFPAAIDVDGTVDMHPLDTGIQYIMAAPVTIDDPLFLEAGFKSSLFAFSKESNTLTYTGTGPMLRGRTFATLFTFTAVTVGNAGEIRIATTDTSEIVIGETVNIASIINSILDVIITNGGTGYDDTGEDVTIVGQTSGASNATGTVTVSGNAIQTLTINDGGSGYAAAELLTVTGLTSGANDALIAVDTRSTDYTQTKAVVIDSVNNTSFDVAGTFVTSSTGSFDRHPSILEISEVKCIGTTTNSLVSMAFTQAGTTEFFMFHLEMEEFGVKGEIVLADSAIVELCEFEEVEGPFIFRSCDSVIVSGNKWMGTPTGSSISNLELGGNIVTANIHSNSFETAEVGDNAIRIFGTGGVDPLASNSRVIVTNNVDMRSTSTSLFQLTGSGIDQSDPRLIVKNNVRSRNSLTGGNAFLNVGVGVVPTNTSELKEVVSASWSLNNDSERFSIDGDGEITYTGIDDIGIIINYHVNMRATTLNDDLFAGIIKNGADVTASETRHDDASNTAIFALAGTVFLNLTNGDALHLGVGNTSGLDGIAFLSGGISLNAVN